MRTERAGSIPGGASLALGRSTAAAVVNGARVTLVRLIEAEFKRAQTLCHSDASLLLCGGGATEIAADLNGRFEIVPDLVLDGLGFALP